MQYWLINTNRKNAEIILEKNIWGVSRRFINQLMKSSVGDKALVYTRNEIVDKNTTYPPSIVGAFEVASEMYEDTSKIFHPLPQNPEETFPLRIKLKPVKIFRNPLEFKPLIPQLLFITNKEQWGGHLQGQAMRTIPEEDYRLIISKGK